MAKCRRRFVTKKDHNNLVWDWTDIPLQSTKLLRLDKIKYIMYIWSIKTLVWANHASLKHSCLCDTISNRYLTFKLIFGKQYALEKFRETYKKQKKKYKIKQIRKLLFICFARNYKLLYCCRNKITLDNTLIGIESIQYLLYFLISGLLLVVLKDW